MSTQYSVLDTPFTSVSPLHQRAREVEVRYFCSLSDILRTFGRNYSHRQIIFQTYIPKKLQKQCVESLGPLSSQLSRYNLSDFNVTRLRKITEGRKSRFFLQLKTKKTKRVARVEVSLELTSSRFASLIQFASGGVLFKTRLLDKAHSALFLSKQCPLEAHIDLIHYAGSWRGFRGKASVRQIPKFGLVDIEFPRAFKLSKLDEHARRCFPFLSHAICLLQVKRKIRKHLSARSLALMGLDAEATRKSLRRLEEMLER